MDLTNLHISALAKYTPLAHNIAYHSDPGVTRMHELTLGGDISFSVWSVSHMLRIPNSGAQGASGQIASDKQT